MLAKVIAIGETREQSAKLLAKELRSTHLAGIKTNKDFLVQCLENNSFLKGKTTSDFIPREHKKLFKAIDKKLLDSAMKTSALWLQEHNKKDNKKKNLGVASKSKNRSYARTRTAKKVNRRA